MKRIDFRVVSLMDRALGFSFLANEAVERPYGGSLGKGSTGSTTRVPMYSPTSKAS
jgi:hypothetical protein